MTNTVDKSEIEQFSSLSNNWWNKSGPFSALHSMANARIDFIKTNACRIINQVKNETNMLEGLKCLDIGCGGGILSERLSRLGAIVTGIDASQPAIDVATEHSQKNRLSINYQCITTSELIIANSKLSSDKYDIVIASEVIEHVYDRDLFLSDISTLCRPGGVVVFTTINNSFLGVLMAKFFAENILKILPPNTHDPQKFVSPDQITLEAEKYNIILDNFTGFKPTFKIEKILRKEFGEFKLSSDLSINYGAAGINLSP